ncbi:hypothetical protein AN214_02009 [Pseudoalteromonas sp. P1-9]|uniref:hypothetical protein n=1 Tax=Pseudoalteromonas sp. P1-9 TaxID=1710354 RepID=UPI0006D64D7B|nr:hypothetical protein [Pseudoalteromonas sp. P1-9]KPV95815.1 hypothetical protein AN214_02009 [Pseudoalteromonas sp. P1-9]
MKTVLWLALGLIFSLNCFASNPEDITTWGHMEGKVKSANIKDYTFHVANGEAHLAYQGEAGLKSFGAAGTDFDAAPFIGKKLKFSAEIKSQNSEYSSIWLRVNDSEKVIAFDNATDRSLIGTKDWTPFQIILPVTPGAEHIYAGLIQGAKGSMSARNISFSVTDEKSTANYIYKSDYSLNLDKWRMGFSDVGKFKAWSENGIATIKRISNSYNDESFATWYEHFEPSQFIGKRVQFSAEVKTENVTEGYAGLWMRVDGKHKSLQYDNMKDRGVKGTTGWQTYTVILDITDEQSKHIAFGGLLSGNGQVWIRNVSFSPVGKNIASTNIYKGEQEHDTNNSHFSKFDLALLFGTFLYNTANN